MTEAERSEDLNWSNPLAEFEQVTFEEYTEIYKTRLVQESELLFLREFLFPLLGPRNMKYVIPQYPFLDSEGKSRRIDFGLIYENKKIALEVNGESYHAEGIILNETFDDNLNRQNEILNAGWFLLRFSYSQLQLPEWRQRVFDQLFYLLRKKLPFLLSDKAFEPNYLQIEVLHALEYYREKGWKKGIVVLPTGTGKTFLSAFDSMRAPGRILFMVHRLDILAQSKEAFEKIYPNDTIGYLSGEVNENISNSKILFASKDTLRNPKVLYQFQPNEFDYIIIDEVHHGQAPSYQTILKYFVPNVFLLGLTATPDRMDRKDIFELFDYQKVFEYSLNEAIENGFLVPYIYYGLKDNIDYSNIRFNGSKYNVADLDRNLIIKDRNERILDEYLEKGKGNKAIGFCCSIKHADSMAEFFNSNGIPAKSITSASDNRDELIKDFRENKFTVAFTVDLFNEGVDFPDLRVLLFLRPTESKTIFFQQLGRGLRLCNGKDEVVVIDFIGNYKKANNIRKYLSKGQKEQRNEKNGRVEKIIYEYTPKTKVIFEAEVEQILDRQDTTERDITKEDLVDAYYNLAEQLKKKPTQDDINTLGEFKVARYLTVYGSWVSFLKEIGEHTEFSYHFPQGTHLGHILYILDVIGSNRIDNSYLRPDYVRFTGNYSAGSLGGFQRQTKYKLQAAMEMGLLVDYRDQALESDFNIALTAKGEKMYDLLAPLLKTLDLNFKQETKGELSWSMFCEGTVNSDIRNYLTAHPKAMNFVVPGLLEMDAVNLLLKYLYVIQRKSNIRKNEIYNDFFEAPFVRSYLDRHGLDMPTEEVRKRRIPFLFNVLDALDIINQSVGEITVLKFVAVKEIFRIDPSDQEDITSDRINKLKLYSETGENQFSDSEISILKETFGSSFLTADYFLPIITI